MRKRKNSTLITRKPCKRRTKEADRIAERSRREKGNTLMYSRNTLPSSDTQKVDFAIRKCATKDNF